MPPVTVQIITHNSAATIEICLNSVLAQNIFPSDIVVVDNASQDDSRRLVETYGITVIANPTNVGYATAHNQALRQQNSPYVLTLNPDTRLHPGFIEEMGGTLEKHPDVGSTSGTLLRVEQLGASGATIDGAGLYLQPNRRQALWYEGCSIDRIPTTTRPIFGVDGAAAFYRRAMLDDIAIHGEVFDELFFMHKEDVDVAWRAQWRGWSALHVPSARADHIRSFRPGQRNGVSATLRFYAVRNRYLLLIKNECWQTFLHDSAAIGSYDSAILAYLLAYEHSSLRAVPAALKLWYAMRQKHAHIQHMRRIHWRDMLAVLGFRPTNA